MQLLIITLSIRSLPLLWIGGWAYWNSIRLTMWQGSSAYERTVCCPRHAGEGGKRLRQTQTTPGSLTHSLPTELLAVVVRNQE